MKAHDAARPSRPGNNRVRRDVFLPSTPGYMRLRLPLVGLFALFLTVGCGGSDADVSTQIEPRDVRLVSEDGGLPYFTGVLVNLTDATISSVQVQVSLYDAQNVKVDEMIFPVRDLEPGVEVAFREPVNSDADVASARIAGVLRF